MFDVLVILGAVGVTLAVASLVVAGIVVYGRQLSSELEKSSTQTPDRENHKRGRAASRL